MLSRDLCDNGGRPVCEYPGTALACVEFADVLASKQ